MSWERRFLCKCGNPHHYKVSFSNPWFFSDELCPDCGRALKFSTVMVTCRWVPGSLGIFRKPRREADWEYHPDSLADVPDFARKAGEQ